MQLAFHLLAGFYARISNLMPIFLCLTTSVKLPVSFVISQCIRRIRSLKHFHWITWVTKRLWIERLERFFPPFLLLTRNKVYYRGVVHSVNRHILFLRNRKPLSFSSKNRHRLTGRTIILLPDLLTVRYVSSIIVFLLTKQGRRSDVCGLLGKC